MARTKITEEQRIQICAMVGVGCSLRSAARLAGCFESTVRSLLARDKTFAARYRKAEQSCELIALRNVQTASQKNWRAAAWLLERMRPNDYAPPKPDAIQPRQVSQILDRFADIVRREVKDPADRKRVGQEIVEFDEFMAKLMVDYQRDRLNGVHRKPRKTEAQA